MLGARQGTTESVSWPLPAGGEPHYFPIDPNGNLLSKVDGADTWTYTWNAENQLTKVEKNGAEIARFGYDPRGRRVEKVSAGVTLSYTYDGWDVLRATRGTAISHYVHGPRTDEPLEVDDGSAPSYFQADGLGSIVKTTNAAGAQMLERRYDAWGSPESGGAESGYAFTGREWDAETGLYYYRARYYNASVARFMTEDGIPTRGRDQRELNAYAYVTNNPTVYRDPFGFSAFELCVQTISREVEYDYCAKKGTKGGNRRRAPDDFSCREAHCITNCRITRECFGWSATATAASYVKESYDEIKKRTWDPNSAGWDSGDMNANRKGQICGGSRYTQGWTCEELCRGTR